MCHARDAILVCLDHRIPVLWKRDVSTLGLYKIHYGKALVRQKCERLLPVTSLFTVQARFPAVARLSDAGNMAS